VVCRAAEQHTAADYKVDRRTIRHDLVQRGQLLPLVIEGEPE
jgi:hypothetical protein